MSAVEKVMSIAASEVGYLEKYGNTDLYDKTANAGSENYTKYWAEIKPDYQGQPWCACFVTWCLVQAFGKDKAAQLLGHYPYVYCPTGLAKAKAQGRWSQEPSVGAVVIFGNASGTASHTGLVSGYDKIYVHTIEGNTSSGATVIANGGAVFRKSYKRNYSRILGYWALNYAGVESEELMSKEYEELKAEMSGLKTAVDKLNSKMIYNYMDENMPSWARPTIQKMMDKGLLKGNERGELGLTDELLRVFVICDRAGVYDHRWDGTGE